MYKFEELSVLAQVTAMAGVQQAMAQVERTAQERLEKALASGEDENAKHPITGGISETTLARRSLQMAGLFRFWMEGTPYCQQFLKEEGKVFTDMGVRTPEGTADRMRLLTIAGTTYDHTI